MLLNSEFFIDESFRMIGKLSDVSHPQIDIRREEAGIRSAEKLERGMQTEEMKRKEQGNDPVDRPTKGTQTEQINGDRGEKTKNITVSQQASGRFLIKKISR